MESTAQAETGQPASVTHRGGRPRGSAMFGLAWLIRFVFGAAAAVIVAAILLRVLGANPANQIVVDVHRWGRDLVGPFHNLFSIRNAKIAVAVNWGIAALVIAVVGDALSRIVARIGLAADA